MSDNPYESPRAPTDPPEPTRSRWGCVVTACAVLIGFGLLIALLLPAVRSAGPAAHRAQCLNNLKQIALAMHNYADTYGTLPPAYTVDADGKPLHSWRTLLLSYLEQKPLYDRLDLSKPWNDPVNKEAYDSDLPCFKCPTADLKPCHTTYLVVMAQNGCFRPGEGLAFSEIADNHSLTLLVVDALPKRQVHWMSPTDISEEEFLADGIPAKAQHPDGVQVAFVDGSARQLSPETDTAALRAMISIDGNDDYKIPDELKW